MIFSTSLSAVYANPRLRYGLIVAGIAGIAIAALLSLRLGPVAFPWYTAGGKGTDADPYLIATCRQLHHIANVPGAAYALATDIDCAPASGGPLNFRPILGTDGFTGALDGRGHTVRGVVIDHPDLDDVGLFAMLGAGGRVSHLILNVDVVGRDSVGGLAGLTRSGAVVMDVIVRGHVHGRRSVGVVTGINEGTLRSVRGETTVEGDDAIGGIAGYNIGLIRDAIVSGAVRGGKNVGGVAGINRGATIDGCTLYGSVDGKENVGTVVGWMIGGEREASAVAHCTRPGKQKHESLPSIGKQGIAADFPFVLP